jgi:hypothetical protein
MKLFILSGFETRTYSTHTIFYATSLSEVDRLVKQFASWLIDHYDMEDDESNDGFIVDAFSNELYRASSDTRNKSNITEAKLYVELMKCIRDVDSDELMFNNSQVDGD